MKIKKFYENLLGSHSLIFITMLSLALHIILLPVQSGDYIDFLHPWFMELKQHGGVYAIGEPVGNYMVSYIYILALLTHLPVPDLISIKAISFIGDIFLAIYSKKLAYSVWNDERLSNIVYTTILLLPTVLLNSGAWAQCDSLYTAALVACLYYLTKNLPHRAMICFSIGFVFKLQSVFLAPLLLAALIQKKVKFRHFAWVPAVYLLTIWPAYMMGRPLKELLFLYVDQAGTYQSLSMNAANFYSWFPAYYENSFLANCGIATAFSITLATALFIFHRRIELQSEILVWIALLAFFWVPFTLPHMHERYFFAADIISMILFLEKPKERQFLLIIPTCSLLLTIRFLTGALWISPAILSIPMFITGIRLLKIVYFEKVNCH